MAKRPRCVHCGKAFTPPRRGRPPAYCCASHRRRAYRMRRARGSVAGRPECDIDDLRTQAELERAVADILRRYGVLPAAPKPRRHIVKDGDERA